MTTKNMAALCAKCGNARGDNPHRSSLHPEFHLFVPRKGTDRVRLTYNDSRNPGAIVLQAEDDRYTVRLTMSPQEATELAFRLLNATQASGYDVTARKAAR